LCFFKPFSDYSKNLTNERYDLREINENQKSKTKNMTDGETGVAAVAAVDREYNWFSYHHDDGNLVEFN